MIGQGGDKNRNIETNVTYNEQKLVNDAMKCAMTNMTPYKTLEWFMLLTINNICSHHPLSKSNGA